MTTSSASEDFTYSEKLINIVASYPALWDKTCQDYKDTPLKDSIWRVIAEKMENDVGKYVYIRVAR